MNGKEVLLEIIVCHWNEPAEVCEKFFQSLDIQRGMRQGECTVTLVQDGDAGALDEAALTARYPFIRKTIHVPHGGISAARNAGMDGADARFIMFCDCDDMFYHAAAVRMTLDAIRDAGERADLIWGPVWIENREKESGEWFKTRQEWNSVFIHGKAWRLQWLRENNIRFEDGLDYSEDSLFCAVAALEMDPARIGRIPEPVYMWCLRGGSCTSRKENLARNREHLMRHRIMMPEICRKRGKDAESLRHACRGIFDAYHELCGGTVETSERKRLEKMVARGLVIPWGHAIREVSVEDGAELLRISWETTKRKGMIAQDGPDTPLGVWLAKLREEYAE